MKKTLFLTALLFLVFGVTSKAQTEIQFFVIQDDTGGASTDTLYVAQSSIVRVDTVAAGGSSITFIRNGSKFNTEVIPSVDSVATIFGSNNALFSTTVDSETVLLNALRVIQLEGDNPTTIWYEGAVNRNIEATETRASILAKMNAL